MNIKKKDKNYIWHPFTQMKNSPPPTFIKTGKGTLLFDENKKSYIDAISSWWVNIHGHTNPYISSKIIEQSKKLDQIIFANFTHEPAVLLCEKLTKILPENQKKFFFSGDGSSAIEIALKMCIQFWINKGEKKTKFIAIEGGYHGETFGAMSTGGRSIFNQPYSDFLFETEYIPLPKNENKTIDRLKKIILKNKIAGFIFEPLIQGASGMRCYSKSILDKIIEICKNNDIICVADEVMTGFGRTGSNFAVDQINNTPDIICLSKSLSGGTIPISLTTCTQKIYNTFLDDKIEKAFLHGHSYTANPLGCAASIASIELLLSKKCKTNIKKINNCHIDFINSINNSKKIKNIKSVGTILRFQIDNISKNYSSKKNIEIQKFFLDKGILLRPIRDVMYLMPPYCITKKELYQVYKAFEAFIEIQ